MLPQLLLLLLLVLLLLLLLLFACNLFVKRGNASNKLPAIFCVHISIEKLLCGTAATEQQQQLGCGCNFLANLTWLPATCGRCMKFSLRFNCICCIFCRRRLKIARINMHASIDFGTPATTATTAATATATATAANNAHFAPPLPSLPSLPCPAHSS